MAMEALDVSPYKLTERRIAQLTLVIGVTGAACAAYIFSIRVGAGILVGALVAWIGFLWLESALDALARVTTAAAGSSRTRPPIVAILKIVGRYVLMTGAVYVTFSVFRAPVVSILVGLCALGAATILASLYEVWHPVN
jgi:HAMP domain-containing protein